MANIRQLSFAAGEISPALYGRVDLIKYATGVKACLNWIVQRYGGLSNRPGTQFVGEIKDSTKTIKFIPFVFNPSQTYVLEFGNLYMRVVKNGDQVKEAAKNITGATNANPCVITSAGHSYSNGQEVFVEDVGGMTELNNRNFKVANVAANTFELQTMDGVNLDSSLYGTYTSGGTAKRIYEIVTTYVEADLAALQYSQSADVITLVHPSYPVRELTRSSDTSWSIANVTFGPSISAPTNLLSSSPGAGFNYVVTAVDAETGEESLPSTLEEATIETSTLTWTAVAGAGQYNIYKQKFGIYGWIGVAGTNTFTDATYTPDILDEPPADRQPFGSSNNYPSTTTLYQQRRVFANTNNDVEGTWTSKSGFPKNFNKSTPSQDDDPVTFSLIGRQVNEIKHILDLDRLVIFTESSIYVAKGDASGVLTPSTINLGKQSGVGASDLRPLEVGDSAIFVQARGSVIRDLNYSFERDGYRGNELSIFASHLVDNKELVDWAYQEIPQSVIWIVRDDGALLGLTYVREQEVMGWHRHSFENGLVENVCVVPEGLEDVLYICIKRTINGRVVRYVERMTTRQLVDIVDMVFMDCSLTYDGRNTTATTMTLSGGSTWAYDEDLTLTASSSFFVSTDIGNEIHFTGITGNIIRCEITAYTSGTVVTVRPNKTVPVALRGVATTDWSKAVDQVGGLWHIEGEDVSVFGDGLVVSNPNNDAYDVITVANGIATLDRPYAVIHVGLPITSDIETLNIDVAGTSSMSDKKKRIDSVTAFVSETRGLWAGIDADNLTEFKLRSDEGYDDPPSLQTGTIDIQIKPEWNSTGKVFIRQIDPVPASILTIVPAGHIGG